MIKIGIHSAPRSGSTWLGQILNSSPNVVYKYQPLFSYSLKGFLNETSQSDEIDAFFEKLLNIKDDFLDQQGQVNSGKIPQFKKDDIRAIAYKEVRYHNILSHLLATHPKVKIIGIIRNPLSVISSWLLAPKEFRKDLGWEEMEEWRYATKKNLGKAEEFNGFEKWKEVCYLFLKLEKEFSSRFYLVEYKQLISRPFEEVEKLFRFIDLPITSQTIKFIEESTSRNINDPYSVFRAAASDEKWKTELNPLIEKEIKRDLKDTPLERFLN